MKLAVIMKVMSMLYSQILRDLLRKAIDDPDQEWDDFVLGLCDKIFGYEA